MVRLVCEHEEIGSIAELSVLDVLVVGSANLLAFAVRS